MRTALAVAPDNRVTMLGFKVRLGLFGLFGVIVEAKVIVPGNPPTLVIVIAELPPAP